jgi:hypothetical protein
MKRVTVLAVAVTMAAAAAGLVTTASSVAAGSLPTLTLTVTKSTVTVGGSVVSGAMNIVTTVKGEPSDSPGLVLLKPGVTVTQFAKVVSSLGENTPVDAIDPYGTIVFNGSATEGTPSHAQAVLPAGTYVALNNGNGHAVFTVSQSTNPAALPRAAATVRAIDFGFRGATTLRDGELVRFQNDGFLVHMFQYAQVKNATDARKAEADLIAGNINAATKFAIAQPGLFANFISSGAAQQTVITEPPGVYVMFCSMNTQDGRDHYQLGMVRTIRVVR